MCVSARTWSEVCVSACSTNCRGADHLLSGVNGEGALWSHMGMRAIGLPNGCGAKGFWSGAQASSLLCYVCQHTVSTHAEVPLLCSLHGLLALFVVGLKCSTSVEPCMRMACHGAGKAVSRSETH